MQPTSQPISLADRRTINLVQWDGQGPVCVLLHGCGDCAWIWRPVAAALAAHARVLAVDLPGHGGSSCLDGQDYSAVRAAQDVEAALARYGVGRFFLVGHSLGGEVAIHLADRAPRRLAGLVLADHDPELASVGALEILRELRAMPRRFAAVEALGDYLAARHPLARTERLRRFAEDSLEPAGDGEWELTFDLRWLDAFEAEILAGTANDRLWRILAGIPCPTLVLRGAGSSVLTPAVAKRMAHEVLPRGSLEVVPIAGHNLMLDNPDAMSALVTAFLARHA